MIVFFSELIIEITTHCFTHLPVEQLAGHVHVYAPWSDAVVYNPHTEHRSSAVDDPTMQALPISVV